MPITECTMRYRCFELHRWLDIPTTIIKFRLNQDRSHGPGFHAAEIQSMLSRRGNGWEGRNSNTIEMICHLSQNQWGNLALSFSPMKSDQDMCSSRTTSPQTTDSPEGRTTQGCSPQQSHRKHPGSWCNICLSNTFNPGRLAEVDVTFHHSASNGLQC